MQRIYLIIALFICTISSVQVSAQSPQQRLSEEDRIKYLQELRAAKHDFLVKELELTRDQQNAFFPIYDEMEDELNKIADETRALQSKVANNPKASDIEVESAARAMFEQKGREGNVEIIYFEKFKEVLKPKQLLSLKNAERKFTQQLMRHRRK